MTTLLEVLPALSAASWLLVAAGALVVGFSKTALPGGGTIAVALFALALPAKESTAALLLLLIVGDALAVWAYRRDVDVRVLLRLLPSVLAGLVLGAAFLYLAGGETVRRTIGIILLALIALTLWRRRKSTLRSRRRSTEAAASAPAATPAPGAAAGGPAPAGEDAAGAARGDGPGTRRAASVSFGALGGFTTMVANAGGPVMSLYFYTMRMPVLTFLGTSAWFFAVVNVLKLPFSAGLGLITREYLILDALLVPLVLLGAWTGRRIAGRVPQRVFETAVLVLTVVSALALLVV